MNIYIGFFSQAERHLFAVSESIDTVKRDLIELVLNHYSDQGYPSVPMVIDDCCLDDPDEEILNHVLSDLTAAADKVDHPFSFSFIVLELSSESELVGWDLV